MSDKLFCIKNGIWETIVVEPKNKTNYELSELNQFVEGHIEILDSCSKFIVICNEEAILLNKKLNPFISKIYRKPIYGNVLLCDASHVK